MAGIRVFARELSLSWATWSAWELGCTRERMYSQLALVESLHWRGEESFLAGARMTLADVDKALEVWKRRLTAIAENLMQLQEDATYRALTGTGGLERLSVTGVTKATVQPALGAVHVVFLQFGLLQTVISHAENLRSELPAVFGAEAKLREIAGLLWGRSIALPEVDIPLEERTLLSGIRSSQSVTPEELLPPMEKTFAAARDAVLRVDRAWTEFADNCRRVETELGRLRGQTALPSGLLAADLEGAAAKLDEVREHVKKDPLGAEGELRSAVEPMLARVAQRVEAAAHLEGSMRAARARWEELRRMHKEAVTAAEEAREKVVHGEALAAPVAEEKMQGLGEWLGRLERKRDEGAAEAVGIGLRNWCAAADGVAAEDRKACSEAQARVEARRELRGRMDALKAKARAYGVAESDGVAELGVAAEEMLFRRPTDLKDAAAAVARYEQRLSGARGNVAGEGLRAR